MYIHVQVVHSLPLDTMLLFRSLRQIVGAAVGAAVGLTGAAVGVAVGVEVEVPVGAEVGFGETH